MVTKLGPYSLDRFLGCHHYLHDSYLLCTICHFVLLLGPRDLTCAPGNDSHFLFSFTKINRPNGDPGDNSVL
jgi:hypothetical protein